MAFSDFTFPQVQQDLGLVVDEADLFSPVPPIPLREDFITTPILLEVRRLCGGAVGLFSGVPLDVDPAKGLNGVCDFLLTKPARQFILSSPIVVVVEAKNDNLRNGLGQCIAAT